MARLMRPKDVVRDLSKVAKKHGYRVSFTYQMGDTSTTEAGTETTETIVVNLEKRTRSNHDPL